jgi:hypothetical protein
MNGRQLLAALQKIQAKNDKDLDLPVCALDSEPMVYTELDGAEVMDVNNWDYMTEDNKKHNKLIILGGTAEENDV